MTLRLNQIWRCKYGRRYKILRESADEWFMLDMDSKIADLVFKIGKEGSDHVAYCHELRMEDNEST